MAISRAQLLKELLPGLNALFGLEYARYEPKHRNVASKKKQNCQASLLHLLKTKAPLFVTTMHKKHGQHDTTTKQSLWVSP